MVTWDSTDLIVLSHLRWDFLFQRPQHILSRYGRYRRVYYFEEPLFGMTEIPRLHIKETPDNVLVVVPHIPTKGSPQELNLQLAKLLDELIEDEEIIEYSLWYYTPMALNFTRHLKPQNIIFDLMDELINFYEDKRQLGLLEKELTDNADLVFMNGRTLFNSKKHLNSNIHELPSSIDFKHFSLARQKLIEPDDQVHIPHPRIGFYGVIDQRVDLEIIGKIAELEPLYQFIVLGPIINVKTSELPIRNNIHFLDKKDYHALPLYLAGWDCVFMPYRLDDSTKLFSPAKILEFLAAGKPVVASPLPDIIYSYKGKELIHLAKSPEEFIKKINLALQENRNEEWITKIDSFLQDQNWDDLFSKMIYLESDLAKDKTRNMDA